ncbi:MAG: lactococcin 972 family bacteriocin [Bifidobacteriaceae bacterium]|nr:lactococcin 972 family bacteriocin [Bifidobacteriaceae bacterium]
MTSSYNHPDYRHYATAIGTGYATVHADAGATAKAKTGRAFSGNECYYGKS